MPSESEILHTHKVPGKIVKEWVIPARGYAAFHMEKGQGLRFVDIEGKQVPDLVCFNAMITAKRSTWEIRCSSTNGGNSSEAT